LEPTGLISALFDCSMRFGGVLWRRLLPAPAQRLNQIVRRLRSPLKSQGRLTDERHDLTARFVSSLVPFSRQPGDARDDIVLIRAQHAPAKPTNNR